MAKFPRDIGVGNLHPRETLFISGNLGSLGSELILPADGCGSLAVDLRGTFVATFELQGSINGLDWTLIPVWPRNQVAIKPAAIITAAGIWVGDCAPFRMIRIRCIAYTSGAPEVVILADNAPLVVSITGMVTTDLVTNVGASGAAVTLTLPSPGAGLRHYLTFLEIVRFAAVALVPSATPVTVTTTNLPGALAFTMPADNMALGATNTWRKDFAYPLAAAAQATATTIICPVTTSVISRLTCGFYVGP